MTEKFSNNATPKYLGYVYQILIAIEQCFEANKNETIWIECLGDVSNGDTSTEVKHHYERTNLTSNSDDFWKTLKNLVIEDVSSFNSLILHTTANISKDSIFCGWNELTKTKKYKRLESHSPSQTIKPYYELSIKKTKRKDLLPILEKLSIKSSQLNIKEKREELKEDRIFVLIDDERKDDALDWVYGYINRKALNDRYNWHIKINDFQSACRFALGEYTQNKIPFQIIDSSEIDCSKRNFRFVEEMKNIELKEKSIQRALSDYFRAEKNRLKLLVYEPLTMSDILDKYDNSVLDVMGSLKDQYSEKITEQELNTKESLKVSRDLYFECKRAQLIGIPKVDNTQKYYQDGRMHHNVNERRFFWRICKDDLE